MRRRAQVAYHASLKSKNKAALNAHYSLIAEYLKSRNVFEELSEQEIKAIIKENGQADDS